MSAIRTCHSRYFSSYRLVVKNHDQPNLALKIEEYQPMFDKKSMNSVLLSLVGAPVNHSDMNFIQGVYPIKNYTLPSVVGFEGVFKVKEVGSGVSTLSTGDLVYLPYNFLGTWTDWLVAEEDQLIKIPDVFKSSIDAATFKINPFTALRILEDFVYLKDGDVIVQNGATSHVGQAIIQIAKARNITTINIIKSCSYEEQTKKDLIELGGTYVVTEEQARSKSYSDIVGHSIPKAKLALNIVGDKSVYNLVKMTENGGTIVTIGGVSMKPLSVPTSSLIFRNHKYVGFWLNNWIEKYSKTPIYSQTEQKILDYYKMGVLKGPLYTKSLPLTQYSNIFLPKDNSCPSNRYIFVPSY